MINMTTEELEKLEYLVRKLERNRHFIGNGVSVGQACMNLRIEIDANREQLTKLCEEFDRVDGPLSGELG
jgi:hypothetical protein